MNARTLTTIFWFALASTLFADGPADNLPDKVRRVPPPGLAISADDRKELSDGVAQLGREIETLRGELKSRPALLALLPDAQIYHKAVHWALTYDEFYKTNETQTARALLRQGMDRVQSLRDGKAPWLTATGLLARGYVSRVDGSVQPYGLVVPASYQPGAANPLRLDFWFHGRGETLTELDFIAGRQKSAGEFAPPHALVLHLYGRYCNGNRFAGETDLFEALDQVRKLYPVDEDRMVVRGFSLGGAACWHFATHHGWRWAAAAPGAGFSETADFLKVFQNEKLQPAWYEQKLWHLYDATDHAINLFNCPTVAYSGETDRQKQAADMMARALAAEGLLLTHVIGPKTAHSYEKNAKTEINRRIDAIVARGRDPLPAQVRFTDLDAALQPVALGHGGRPGAALGARPRGCEPGRAEWRLRGDDEKCLGADTGDSTGPLSISAEQEGEGHSRRTEVRRTAGGDGSLMDGEIRQSGQALEFCILRHGWNNSGGPHTNRDGADNPVQPA